MTEHECHHLLDKLSDYVDGVLDDALCAVIEAHMAECENCRVVVDTLALTVRLYRDSPAPDLPDDVRSRLYASLDLADYLSQDADER